MRRMLFLMVILTLVSFGCNRSGEQSSGGGTGMQQEEQINRNTPTGDVNSPDSSMGSNPETGTMSGDNMDPAANDMDSAPAGNSQQQP